jgi:hypothetical protein
VVNGLEVRVLVHDLAGDALHDEGRDQLRQGAGLRSACTTLRRARRVDEGA